MTASQSRSKRTGSLLLLKPTSKARLPYVG
jgi:hypothetical protein